MKGSKRLGVRAGLLGCALSRAELVRLDVEQIQIRADRWLIPDLPVGLNSDFYVEKR